MKMKIFDKFPIDRAKKSPFTVITFTGGMGAQIISAAIYFDMSAQGLPVYADLSYFDRPKKVAREGDKGMPSHWDWQLDFFGIAKNSFENLPVCEKAKGRVISDGVEKLELSLTALAKEHVRQRFATELGLTDIDPRLGLANYVCIHIRRGDYTNVASHLVPDNDFIAIAKRLSGLVSTVVVLSDSALSASLRSEFSGYFEKAIFLDHTDAWAAHRVMRGAAVIVCSNSQFSLAASMLNPTALVAIPGQWFEGEERAIEAPLRLRSPFALLLG